MRLQLATSRPGEQGGVYALVGGDLSDQGGMLERLVTLLERFHPRGELVRVGQRSFEFTQLGLQLGDPIFVCFGSVLPLTCLNLPICFLCRNSIGTGRFTYRRLIGGLLGCLCFISYRVVLSRAGYIEEPTPCGMGTNYGEKSRATSPLVSGPPRLSGFRRPRRISGRKDHER